MKRARVIYVLIKSKNTILFDKNGIFRKMLLHFYLFTQVKGFHKLGCKVTCPEVRIAHQP